MKFTSRKLNLFTVFNLPAAYFTGVRTKSIDAQKCIVTVKHRWINQNPFKSMFWAVQGMAAELATGALVMASIAQSDAKISMLVATNNARFDKKATGRITFTCEDGLLIKDTIAKAIQTKQGQSCWTKAVGKNSLGAIVSEFNFQWTLKVRS